MPKNPKRLEPSVSRRNARNKKTRNPGYEVNNHWNICDLCGCAVRNNDTRSTWDGLVVCPDDCDYRHPQDFVRGKEDDTRPVGLSRPGSEFNLPPVTLPYSSTFDPLPPSVYPPLIYPAPPEIQQAFDFSRGVADDDYDVTPLGQFTIGGSLQCIQWANGGNKLYCLLGSTIVQYATTDYAPPENLNSPEASLSFGAGATYFWMNSDATRLFVGYSNTDLIREFRLTDGDITTAVFNDRQMNLIMSPGGSGSLSCFTFNTDFTKVVYMVSGTVYGYDWIMSADIIDYNIGNTGPIVRTRGNSATVGSTLIGINGIHITGNNMYMASDQRMYRGDISNFDVSTLTVDTSDYFSTTERDTPFSSGVDDIYITEGNNMYLASFSNIGIGYGQTVWRVSY